MIKNFKWLFEDSPTLLLGLDGSLICRDMTVVWREQLALPDSENAAEDRGMPIAELFDFKNNPAVLDQFNAVINDGIPMVDVPVGLLMSNGTRKARLCAWRVQHVDDEQPCIMVAATDVSEFDRAYEELSRLQTQYQLILDAAGEGIYGLDCNGKITFSNASATGILGWKIEDRRPSIWRFGVWAAMDFWRRSTGRCASCGPSATDISGGLFIGASSC